MRDLANHLLSRAPESADALEVIGYFDALTAHGAGVGSIVRATAALARTSVTLIDRAGTSSLRVEPDGSRARPGGPANPAWPRSASDDGVLELIIERGSSPEGSLDPLIAERALLAVTARVRGAGEAASQDPLVAARTAVDADAAEALRHRALRVLGFSPEARCRVVALADGTPILIRHRREGIARADGQRAGIGPALSGDQAPAGWREARAALALTAEGTNRDPGDRIVAAEDAGSLLWLALADLDFREPPADVVTLEERAADHPWLLETVDAVSATSSLRDAAGQLGLHHSTVQERVNRASDLLGWNLVRPSGRQRAQLALALRRIRRNQTS